LTSLTPATEPHINASPSHVSRCSWRVADPVVGGFEIVTERLWLDAGVVDTDRTILGRRLRERAEQHQRAELVADLKPLGPEETFDIPDMTDAEWDEFVATLSE